jgi:hypothetical protein
MPRLFQGTMYFKVQKQIHKAVLNYGSGKQGRDLCFPTGIDHRIAPYRIIA